MSEWTIDSNEAVCLSLVRAKEDVEQRTPRGRSLSEVFHPKFTYPIFGEEEKIYGYENLHIKLYFASGSLRQYLSVTYSSVLKSSNVIDDPEKALFQYIPTDYVKSKEAFEQYVEEDARNFKPCGKKIHSYIGKEPDTGKGRPNTSELVKEGSDDASVYEIYHSTWDTPGFLEHHRRMQIFVLFYIEAGSYIEEEDSKWEFFTLYERSRRKDGSFVYNFVGYSTVYPFYFYPASTRLRLSQFVIVPPYQKHGHGSALYRSIYRFVVESPRFAELTVENPSEEFEDLRDKIDLKMLYSNEQFMKEAFAGESTLSAISQQRPKRRRIVTGTGKKEKAAQPPAVPLAQTTKENIGPKLGPPIKKVWAEKWRKQLKLAKRQYDRLIEMITLHALDPNDEMTQRAFRLQVKARLKVFNFEALAQMEQEEQYEKLEETFQNVKEGYMRMLQPIH